MLAYIADSQDAVKMVMVKDERQKAALGTLKEDVNREEWQARLRHTSAIANPLSASCNSRITCSSLIRLLFIGFSVIGKP